MNDKAFTFQTLHPDTIIDALFDQGIRVDSGLTPLNSYENRVYQFQDEDRRRMVVKFYRPERWSADQILEEHLFAQELLNDVPVQPLQEFTSRQLYILPYPPVHFSHNLVDTRFTIIGFQVAKSPAMICLRASPASHK